MTNDDEVTRHLTAMPLRRLVELLTGVLAARSERHHFPDGEFDFDVLCLAMACWGKFEGKVDERAEVDLLGVPTAEVAHVDWGDVLTQQGRCEGCKCLVLSVAKLAVCPVCGAEVRCT